MKNKIEKRIKALENEFDRMISIKRRVIGMDEVEDSIIKELEVLKIVLRAIK